MRRIDRKSTRLNSSHTVIYTLSLHDALPISTALMSSGETKPRPRKKACARPAAISAIVARGDAPYRSEERRVGKECRSRCDWSSDVCSSDLDGLDVLGRDETAASQEGVRAPGRDQRHRGPR